MIADLMLVARPPRLARGCRSRRARSRHFGGDGRSRRRAKHSTRDCGERTGTGPRRSGAHARCVAALLNNSLEAIGEGGRIDLAVRSAAVADRRPGIAGSQVEIIITDTGPGIAPEIRGHIFEPFFSGREAGRGLGLGLSKCWRIVTEHGGRIELESPAEGGALPHLFAREGLVGVRRRFASPNGATYDSPGQRPGCNSRNMN